MDQETLRSITEGAYFCGVMKGLGVLYLSKWAGYEGTRALIQYLLDDHGLREESQIAKEMRTLEKDLGNALLLPTPLDVAGLLRVVLTYKSD